MAYESIGYDVGNAEHAALRDAASDAAKYDERHEDAAEVSADEQARDAAQWSEGAPACLAAVIFAQRMQRRLQTQAHAQAQEGHAGGDDPPVAGRAHPAEHI